MTDKVTIIIPSYNTENLTISCLDSIYKKTKDVNMEIILVDNASKDRTVDKVKKIYPAVKLITNHFNVGFGAANNQGAKISTGKYLLFLNSDTILKENSVKIVSDWLNQHPRVQAATCKLTNPDGSLQYNLGTFPGVFRVLGWMFFIDDLPLINKYFRSFHLQHPRWYQAETRIDWAMGAFLMIKKDAFKKINGFDEKMFMYAEEVELQYRLSKQNFSIYYIPSTAVVHLGRSSSRDTDPSLTTSSELTGIAYFANKHLSHAKSIAIRIIVKIGILLRILAFSTFKKNITLKQAYKHAFQNI